MRRGCMPPPGVFRQMRASDERNEKRETRNEKRESERVCGADWRPHAACRDDAHFLRGMERVDVQVEVWVERVEPAGRNNPGGGWW